MIVNRRAIDACPALKTLCSVGLSADQLQELDAKRARTSIGGAPRTSAEKEYVLQKVIGLADARYGASDVIVPESIMALSDNDAIVRGIVRSVQKKTAALCFANSALSTA